MRSYDIITFDCYGTLVDWESGIRAAFETEASRAGVAIDLDAVVDAYHRIEPKAEAGPFRLYREVLGVTEAGVAQAVGLRIEPSRAGFLAAGLPDWPIFPDTRPALARLSAAGTRLGILSNVDNDLLAGTLQRLDAPIDPNLIVTAEAVRSYKPGSAHFKEARRRVGPTKWLHAAQSRSHDIAPAIRLAIPAAWVDRKNEHSSSVGSSPTLLVHDLGELTEQLLQK